MTAAALAEQLASAEPPLVLDVRAEREWREKRIAGSLNVPLARLERELGQLPRDGRIVVHWASGYRSSIAASLLRRHGFAEVADLVGGLGAWESSRLETATPLPAR